MRSRLLPDAPAYARGFIGVAFRINEDDSVFEGMYIRPTNGRSEDQLRRNRSTQYFSFPDYKFDRFREESPSVYESYADIGLDEWIDIRIEVDGSRARMFLNGGSQPVLIVNDLKHGSNKSGSIGLWVEVGTEGFFKNLRITLARSALPEEGMQHNATIGNWLLHAQIRQNQHGYLVDIANGHDAHAWTSSVNGNSSTLSWSMRPLERFTSPFFSTFLERIARSQFQGVVQRIWVDL